MISNKFLNYSLLSLRPTEAHQHRIFQILRLGFLRTDLSNLFTIQIISVDILGKGIECKNSLDALSIDTDFDGTWVVTTVANDFAFDQSSKKIIRLAIILSSVDVNISHLPLIFIKDLLLRDQFLLQYIVISVLFVLKKVLI